MGLADGTKIEGENSNWVKTPLSGRVAYRDKVFEATDLQRVTHKAVKDSEERVRSAKHREIRRINSQLLREAQNGKYSATAYLPSSHKVLDSIDSPQTSLDTVEIRSSEDGLSVKATDNRLNLEWLVAESVISEYRTGGMKISKAPDEDAINIAWERPNE